MESPLVRSIEISIMGAMAFAGCAYIEVLPDGSKRVTGLVHTVIPPAIPAERRGAETLEITALGLAIVSARSGGGITLGYTNERITTVRNDAVVVMTPQTRRELEETGAQEEKGR